jgi:uncharacterized protein with von Willebrand factor type A (vWA) domain
VKKQKQDLQVILHDGFDDMAFERVADYEAVDELCRGPQSESSTALTKDVFTAFYKMKPEVLDDTKSLTKDIVGEFLEMPEYKNFHQNSVLDAVPSALGAIEMTPVLLKKLEEIQKQIEQKRDEQKKQNKQNGKDPNDGVPQGEPGLDELDQEGMSSLRQAMRKAVGEAQEKSDENQALMRSWGVEPGELKEMDAKERLELADQLREQGQLKNVSNLMGRFKNVVSASLATIPSHGHDEIIDIGLGGDISRMLPSEAIKLTQNPMLFYKDFAEKNLLVYNLRGVDNVGKGPLLVCFDISGSMMGSREAWAKAFVLALLHYAQQQNRTFAWVAFESRVNDSAIYPKGTKVSLEEKIRIAGTTTTGGTNFWAPLTKCMKLHATETTLKPADIIFITDGECNLSEDQLEEFSAWKKEKEVRVFGVGIADTSNWEHAGLETLEQFSDQICMVNDLGEVSALRQAIHAAHKQKDQQ